MSALAPTYQYLAEAVVYDPSLPGTRTLRFANVQGFITQPSETPANTEYLPVIQQPAYVKRDLFAARTTFGRSRQGFGDLILSNSDGSLDALLNYGFDGQSLTIRRGTPTAAYPSGFTTTPKLTMERAVFDVDTVRIKVRDLQYGLQLPLQPTKYAGTNSLPSGLEGVAGDLQGKPKPVCYGVVINVPAPSVNTSKLTYQVNDGAVSDISAVYDKGASITKGADYANSTLLQAAAVGAGTYATCFAEGYFRLGSSPAGLVTADVTQGANAAARTAGQIFALLLQRAGKTAGDWSASDITALDTANSAVLGYWTNEEVVIADVCDLVAGSVGAWWGQDNSGVLRIQQLVAPTGTPVATFTQPDLLVPPQILDMNDPGSGVPIYSQTVRYQRNYAVQASDLAGSVTDARKAVIAAEWRDSITTDTSVQTAHPLAPALVETSLLTAKADADAEASRRLTLRKVKRDAWQFVYKLTPDTDAVDLGTVISQAHPRYGISAGKLFTVIGIEPNAAKEQLTITAWG